MDSAWAGVAGVAVGAAATLLGSAYTQWRAERLRAEDRAADERRWVRERELEDRRWKRDHRVSERSSRRHEWMQSRKEVYLETARGVWRCQHQLIRAQAFLEVSGAYGDTLADDQPWETLDNCLREMMILAGPSLREVVSEVIPSLKSARRAARAGATAASLQEALDEVDYPIRALGEIIRLELGITDVEQVTKHAEGLIKRGIYDPNPQGER